MKVKDQVQLADVAKVSIEHLDVSVNDFKRYQFVISLTDACDEEQGCISSIDHFAIFVFEEVAHPCSSCEDELGDVLGDLEFGFGRHGGEPFCETYFALSADEEDPVDLQFEVGTEERERAKLVGCDDWLGGARRRVMWILTAMMPLCHRLAGGGLN